MKLLSLTLLSLGLAAVQPAGLAADADRLKDAETVLTEMAGSGDRGIPTDLIAQARCLVIIPGVKRAAMVVGGQYGRGYMSCRTATPTGGAQPRTEGRTWSAPAAIRVEGGSVGFQIGGSETDVILVVRNQSGVDRLLSNQFTVGADASVAAGPVGRQASAHTDATMRAEMLAYSHSRGVFAGIALQGATLREDRDENKDLYGSNVSNRDIVSGSVAAPQVAQGLMAALAKY